MYHYTCKIKRVVDGDTVDGLLDLGFGINYKVRIRLLGINAPESRTRDLKEKVLGLAAKAFLKEVLKGKSVTVETKLDKRGKFGRVLGKLFTTDTEGRLVDISALMISSNHAKAYTGGKR